MKKKNKASAQDIIFNSGPDFMHTRFPHAGKDWEPRTMTGRGFGKTAMIRIVDGKPVLIGGEGGINLEE